MNTIDTGKKCFNMFDGAAKHTIMKMSTPDMKELVEILTIEIASREAIIKKLSNEITK